MASGSGKLRLFVGVRISVDAAEAIARSARTMQKAAASEGLEPRWVAPANYHITLKFLGWTREPLVGAIGDAVAAGLEGAPAFAIETGEMGAFPKPAKARVLWAGARDPDGRLADLAARVEAATTNLGFPAEARSFHPHVTLARLKRPGDAAKLLESASEQGFRESWIDSVVLFESVMKSGGSEYVSRAVWPLEAPGSGRRRQT